MLINKIFLSGGQIASRVELNPEEMNPDLMRQAEEALSALHSGTPSISVVLADGSELTLYLGLHPHDYEDPYEQRMQDQWRNLYPDADISEYENMKKQVKEHHRRTRFNLTSIGISTHYSLIPIDTEEDDPGIYGSVAGSSIHGDPIPWEQKTAEDHANDQKEHERVAEEIVSYKPAVMVRAIGNDPRLRFGDHFAVAMLVADASTQETKEI